MTNTTFTKHKTIPKRSSNHFFYVYQMNDELYDQQYCKSGYQDNFKPAYFDEKILNAQKAPKCKANNFYLLRSFCAHEKLLPLLFLVCFFFCFFSWLIIFVRLKFFSKKKNKQAQNCPDSLIYYTTDVYPYQPTYREFICTHLFLFVIFCENLFFLSESF